jgi:hypothetical protein
MSDITSVGGWATMTGEEILESIRDAQRKLRDWTPPPFVISPHVAKAVTELLGRSVGTTLTQADHAAAVRLVYDRATPEERTRLVEAAFRAGLQGGYA